jgi:hypothetical protein
MRMIGDVTRGGSGERVVDLRRGNEIIGPQALQAQAKEG